MTIKSINSFLVFRYIWNLSCKCVCHGHCLGGGKAILTTTRKICARHKQTSRRMKTKQWRLCQCTRYVFHLFSFIEFIVALLHIECWAGAAFGALHSIFCSNSVNCSLADKSKSIDGRPATIWINWIPLVPRALLLSSIDGARAHTNYIIYCVLLCVEWRTACALRSAAPFAPFRFYHFHFAICLYWLEQYLII